MADNFKALLQVVYDMKQAQAATSSTIKTLQKNAKLTMGIEISDKEARKAMAKLTSDQIKNTKAVAKAQSDTINLAANKKNLNTGMSAYLRNNTKLSSTLRAELVDLQGQIKSADKTKLSQLQKSFSGLKGEASALGQVGNNVFANLIRNTKQLLSFMSSTMVVFGTIRTIKSMATDVKELDTAMTNLRKVSDATDSEFNSFLVTATVNAKTLGASISKVVEATADFARLGYTLPDSTELARVATLYSNVGDIDVSDATTSMISTMKAFNLTADQAESVVDIFNEVGNRFAISSAGIGDSLQKSASSLVEANNTLSQATALTVGANDVMQDPEAVGKHMCPNVQKCA